MFKKEIFDAFWPTGWVGLGENKFLVCEEPASNTYMHIHISCINIIHICLFSPFFCEPFRMRQGMDSFWIFNQLGTVPFPAVELTVRYPPPPLHINICSVFLTSVIILFFKSSFYSDSLIRYYLHKPAEISKSQQTQF